jgi:phosphatidate cytidylyltransferase
LSGSDGGNLSRRAATAAVVLPPLLVALFLGPPLLVVAIVGVAAGIGMLEFFRLLDSAHVAPHKIGGLVAGVAFFLDAALPGLVGRPLWPIGAVALLAGALIQGDARDQVSGAALSLFGSVYLGGLGGTIGGLRLLEPRGEGAYRIALLLAIVMSADTVAFFVGKAFGRHRLAPALSPGKTVEGAIGGLLGGAIGALLIRLLGRLSLPFVDALLLGVFVSALGALGDLFESLLKRWAGVKDSGGLFPGHGGMLDRLDSLLFGAPLLYYYFGTLR